jgi:two-component system alkaline phosphatase synthesis response regulator PhoP
MSDQSLGRRILLVEDEPGLILTLSDRLRSEGYEIGVAQDAPAGFRLATQERWDLLLLDVMLPGGNGFDLVREIRDRGVDTPVIMLTARGEIVDRVLGLKLGADDYLTKPFDMLELLARIEAHVRRRASSGAGAHEHRFGEIAIDTRKAEVRRAGRLLDLSAREFLLLKYFAEHADETLSREKLLNEVWGYRSMPSTRTVDVHVAWLRQKIEASPKHPRHLLTIHGLGYKFVR